MSAHPFSSTPSNKSTHGSSTLFPVKPTKSQAELSFDLDFDDSGCEKLTFVINLEDGGGHEFYLNEDNVLVCLTDVLPLKPKCILASELISQINQIRRDYPKSCFIYGLTLSEFHQRLSAVQQSKNGFWNGGNNYKLWEQLRLPIKIISLTLIEWTCV